MKKIINKFMACLLVVFMSICVTTVSVHAGTTYDPKNLKLGDQVRGGDILKSRAETKISVNGGPETTTLAEPDFYTVPGAATDIYFVDYYYDNGLGEITLKLNTGVTVKYELNGVDQTDDQLLSKKYSFGINDAGNFEIYDHAAQVSKSYSPAVTTGQKLIWQLKSDITNNEYETYKVYDESTPFVYLGDYVYSSDLIINAVVYTPEVSKLEITGNSQVDTNAPATYQIYLLDQYGERIVDNTKTIKVQEVDNTGAGIGAESSITFSDGYSYNFTAPATAGQVRYKFWIEGIAGSEITVIITVEGSSLGYLENNDWPWAVSCGSDEFTLKTGHTDAIDGVTYKWQKANTNDDDAFEYIPDETDDTLTIDDQSTPTWYRCEVSFTSPTGSPVYTKAVEVFHIDDVRASYDSGIADAYYVSNGLGAYTVDPDKGQFDVLGLWNNYWIHTAFDNTWSIYLKTGTDPVVPTDLSKISSIYTRFSNYNNSNVIFDVKLSEAADVAVFTDIALGGYNLFENSDNAALKANVENEQVKNIQMMCSPTFAEAKNDTCAFVVTPITTSVHDGTALNTFSTIRIDSLSNTLEDGSYFECWDFEEDYNDMVNLMSGLIYDYCTSFYIDPMERAFYEEIGYPIEDPAYSYGTVDGKKVVIGLYDDDSVLAFSWANTSEVSFMYGIGKAGTLEGVTFTDLNHGESEEHRGGGIWYPVPNTSASTR